MDFYDFECYNVCLTVNECNFNSFEIPRNGIFSILRLCVIMSYVLNSGGSTPPPPPNPGISSPTFFYRDTCKLVPIIKISCEKVMISIS